MGSGLVCALRAPSMLTWHSMHSMGATLANLGHLDSPFLWQACTYTSVCQVLALWQGVAWLPPSHMHSPSLLVSLALLVEACGMVYIQGTAFQSA